MKRFMFVVLMTCMLVLTTVGVTWAWSPPVLWEHSTAGTERMPWLVGNTLYFVMNYDIYQSTWNGQNWSTPEPVPGKINTAENEINPVVIKSGTVMYFARYSKPTDYDFYRSTWDDATKEWTEPVAVTALNTDSQEWDIWVSEDESLAYVTTKAGYGGAASLGGRDIWKSEYRDGAWSTPVNVDYPINSEKDEWSVYIYNGTIYFDSNRAGTVGSNDIWVAETLTGPVENLAFANTKATERAMAVSDQFFFFSATGREGGAGGYDLWVSVPDK